jgi:hypothetical protein
LYSALQPFLEGYDVELSEDSKELAESLLPSVRRKAVTQIGVVTGLGNGVPLDFNESENEALENAGVDSTMFCLTFHRAIVSGIVITSYHYSLDKQRCDCYVKLTNDNYYQIIRIIKCNDNTSFMLLARKLVLEPSPAFFPVHIKKVAHISDVISAHHVHTVVNKLYFMKVGNKMYFSQLPHSFKSN